MKERYLKRIIKKQIQAMAEEILQNGNFKVEQEMEIRIGCLHGLSINQIEMYAKPEFDNGQMSQNSLFTKGYLFF